MGAGLIMLGGRDSFGAGGWMNTPVEKALPVDMQIKALKVQGIGAMVMIMHASEIAEGNYWQKVVAKAAINALSNYDYAGMLHWEGQEAWLFTLRPIGNGRASMLRAIDRMTPGDMPDFDPSLQMAMQGPDERQGRDDQAHRHHQRRRPDPADRRGDQPARRQQDHRDRRAHRRPRQRPRRDRHACGTSPTKTKGRFYNVTNPKALPRIYQKEARTISRPLIFEQDTPWLPKVNYLSEPITGLHRTRPADHRAGPDQPQGERAGRGADRLAPAGRPGQPACWPTGPTAWAGRSPSPPTPAGGGPRPGPTGRATPRSGRRSSAGRCGPVDRGNLTLTVRREEGRIKVVVDALDKENQFLNFLQIQGNVVSPDLKRSPIELVQTAPGRYEGTVEDAEASGNYFVNLGYRGPDGVQGVISIGRLGPLLRRVPRAAVEPGDAGDDRQPDRRPGRLPGRRRPTAARPAADARRGRPLPPRPAA